VIPATERNVRAYLIKPDQPENFLEEINYDGDWKTIAGHLSYEGRKVELFDCIRLVGGNVAYVDDEGLMYPCRYFVLFLGYPAMIAGRVLILGEDERGESVDVTLSLDDIAGSVVVAVRTLN
jgi:hypothetical protein